MNPIYDFNWLIGIIKSCNNDFHFTCIDALIELFGTKHKNTELVDGLKIMRESQWNLVHAILK